MLFKKHQTQRITLSALIAASVVFAPGDLALAKSKKRPGNSGVEEQLRLKAGDENGNEIKALKTEMLVIKSEKRALSQLQKLHKKYQGTRMEPEILFRLAELYMRRARSERFFEVHKNSDQVVTFVPQLVKDASEKAEINKAIEIYDRIQTKFPRFHSMDVVVFNEAYARQQIGDTKGAEELFRRLITKFADSNLVPDSLLAVGEINYGRREFTAALQSFRAIRKYPRSRVYPYGLYKAAWTYYNLQDAQSGIKQLEEVVAFGRKVASEKLDSKLDLRKEALGDLALYYSDVMPSSGAVDYFKIQAGELDSSPYILRLVELYKRHSKFNDVELVLKDVLAKLPDSTAAASAHEELVWNYERTKQQPKAVAQLQSFDEYCTTKIPVSKKALKKGEQPPRIECQDKIAETSKKLATKWHATWKKFGGDQLPGSAEAAYRLYLKTADGAEKDFPMMRYAFAELTFARGQYREASENYAALDGVKGVEPKIAHDAAYGAVLSLEKAAGDKWSDADEERFNVLSGIYVKNFPKGDYVLDLRFKGAFIAYEKEKYDIAAPQFKAIGWAPMKTGEAVPEKVLKSQDLYLDILNIKKDYKGLREAAQQLLSGSAAKATGPRVTQVEKIYREAYFAEIQQFEEKGEIAKAVEAYKKFALENTTSELASKAWWNASQLEFRMGDAEAGANTCYQMHKLFPKSTNGLDCLNKAAQTFESMGRLDLAARVLLNLSTVEVAKQDHWREVAADFFALSGDKSRAIQMYMKLADDKKGSPQLALFEKAATLARESGDTKTIAQIEAHYSRFGIEPHASRMIVEQAEEAFAKKDFNKAFNLSKKIIGRSGLPKDLLGRARIVQAQVLEDEYRRQSVKSRMERIGLVLAIKTEKLEKAQKAYQSAIGYGDPRSSVTALRRLAGCYLDYAGAVRNMSLPAGTSEADQAAFKGETEQLSIPMEEKGIEAMNQALAAAKKAGLRDGSISNLQTEVDRLNMKSGNAPIVVVTNPSVYVPQFGDREPAAVSKGVGL